ncbi:NAD-dependent epimerase/dehydratase family protein [Lactovum odontotermitis]
MRDKKILITGGAGFIGSTLANSLVSKNEVFVIDDLSMGKLSNLHESSNLTMIEGSVVDKELLKNIFSENKFDYVFHLAAIASVADSVSRPYETHQVNFDSTMTILELLKSNPQNLKRFVFSSSAAVYGNDPSLPKIEESKILPLSPYAVDKFSSERMALVYGNLYGLPVSATRFFNVFGPNQNPNSPYSGIISILIDRLKSGRELTIFGDGEQSRDFVYVEDVVQALILIADSNDTLGNVYNVGTGKATTLNELIKKVEEISQKKIQVNYASPREGDIHASYSDITKLREIGFSPRFSLIEGLNSYLSSEVSGKF